MEELALDSDGGEVDRDEVEEEELATAFPNAFHQQASVSVGLERQYVLGLARVGGLVVAGLDSGQVSVHAQDTLVRSVEMKGHSAGVTGVAAAAASDSTVFTSSSDHTVRVWDVRRGRSVTTLRAGWGGGKGGGQPGPPGQDGRPLACLAASTDGHTLVAGTEQAGVDSFLLFWDLRQPKALQGGYWESHCDDVTAVAFHPSEAATLASGSTDGQVNVFDVSRPDEDAALVTAHHTADSVARLAWYSRAGDGRQLAIGTHTEALQLWHTPAEGPHTTLDRAAVCHGIRRTAVEHTYTAGLHAGAEGLLVVAGSSCAAAPCLRMAVVKNKKVKPLATLGTVGGTTRCSLLVEEGVLVTGGEDGVVRLWREGQAEASSPGTGKVAGSKAASSKLKARDKPY